MADKTHTIAKRLAAQAKKGDFDDKVAVLYRLYGGHGEDGVDDSLVVTAGGELRLKVDDRLEPDRNGAAATALKRKDAHELIQSLIAETGKMTPASEARFVPHTLVGSVTLVLGDEKETYYFEADEEALEHRGKSLKSGLCDVMDRVRDIQSRYICKDQSAEKAGEQR